MSKTKKPAKKKTAPKAKSTPTKKKPLPKIEKVEIDIPEPEEVKTLLVETLNQVQADGFKLTENTKKSFLGKIKSWFKLS